MENEELKQDLPVENEAETIKKEDKSAKKKVGKKIAGRIGKGFGGSGREQTQVVCRDGGI